MYRERLAYIQSEIPGKKGSTSKRRPPCPITLRSFSLEQDLLQILLNQKMIRDLRHSLACHFQKMYGEQTVLLGQRFLEFGRNFWRFREIVMKV